MTIAFISDIHGNIAALEAVLKDALNYSVDKMVFLGDYIFDLPDSVSVVKRLRELTNAVIVAGNKERYLDYIDWQNDYNAQTEQFGVLYQTYSELSINDIAYLRALPDSAFISLPSGKRVYAVHTLPNMRVNGKNIFNSSSSYMCAMRLKPITTQEYSRALGEFLETDLREDLNAIDADIIAYGHNHIQSHTRALNKTIIDAGSCGMPLDSDPRAAYTLVNDTESGIEIIERRVSYDIDTYINHSALLSECHKKARCWSEAVYMSVKTGVDYASYLLSESRRLADMRNETANPFPNEIMREAFENVKQKAGKL